MRLVGRLGDKNAIELFGDYLHGQEIDNEIREEDDSQWGVWVYSEGDIPRARELWAQYREEPEHPKFQSASGKTRRKLAKREKEQARFQNLNRPVKGMLAGTKSGMGPLTIILLLISVGVGIISGLGSNTEILQPLFITEFRVGGGYIQWGRGLPEITGGQVWRLFTPIFIHFGILHLAFNMLWLRDLGGALERGRGTLFLGILVMVLAAFSNVAQHLTNGPSFGGMSGVVYGLLGYLWMKSRFDPWSGFFIHKTTVTMMIVWFFLCWTGLMGPIANTAHTVGLGIGVVWGFISAQLSRSRHFSGS